MSFCMHTDDVTCPNCARQRGEYRYWPYEPRTVGALPVPQLTEADVRRIVREELARTPPHGWLHKDAEDEIKRLRAERDALGWARVELANIVHAERFNKSHFADDTEFADWAQSRARHQLAAIDAAMAEEATTRRET